MRNFRRPILALVFFLTGLVTLVAPPPSQAATTFCYTYTGRYIVCRICEFYGPPPNSEYLGFIDTCWDRAL